MRVIGRNILDQLKKQHANVISAADAWLAEAKNAEWNTPHDVKRRYSHASILSNNRVVFNIGGNKYRLLVKIAYQTKIIVIERAGTHAEYDKWDLK